jgi:hypothetical protein
MRIDYNVFKGFNFGAIELLSPLHSEGITN